MCFAEPTDAGGVLPLTVRRSWDAHPLRSQDKHGHEPTQLLRDPPRHHRRQRGQGTARVSEWVEDMRQWPRAREWEWEWNKERASEMRDVCCLEMSVLYDVCGCLGRPRRLFWTTSAVLDISCFARQLFLNMIRTKGNPLWRQFLKDSARPGMSAFYDCLTNELCVLLLLLFSVCR